MRLTKFKNLTMLPAVHL